MEGRGGIRGEFGRGGGENHLGGGGGEGGGGGGRGREEEEEEVIGCTSSVLADAAFCACVRLRAHVCVRPPGGEVSN